MGAIQSEIAQFPNERRYIHSIKLDECVYAETFTLRSSARLIQIQCRKLATILHMNRWPGHAKFNNLLWCWRCFGVAEWECVAFASMLFRGYLTRGRLMSDE